MSYIRQCQIFTFEDFFSDGDDNHRLLLVFSALEDDALISKLESERKSRRNHYPVRMLWQSLIAAKVYGIAGVNELIRELKRNGSLRRPEFDVRYVMGDKGYDSKENCRYVLYDLGALPIIKMRLTQAEEER